MRRPALTGPRRPATARLGVISLVAGVALTAAACSSSGSSTGTTTSTRASSSPSSRTTGPSTTTTAPDGLPPVRHVFVIVLENEGSSDTFGDPSADPYLASTLPGEGALLTNYYGIGHHSNDNYVALVSGQAPNPDTQGDCLLFADFPAGTTVLPDGQVNGSGCVYPAAVQTVGNQLSAAHLTWKGYEEDMGNVPSRESAVCGHPAVGSPDGTEKAVPGDGYATRHDPFVYFHSIIDAAAYCNAHVVPLGSPTGALPAGTPAGTTGLGTDLRSVATTPNLSVITPNLCDDGHDAPCINESASASALTNVDTFLATWVPKITSSPAYQQDGMLIVTFDEADTGDASACCNEQPGPAAAQPGETGPGGGLIGTVVLSPFVKGGTVSTVPYNHYSTLATIETLFGLPRLGEAQTVSAIYGKDVFTGQW